MLNSKSIKGRLGVLFLAFVMLVSISVGATFWGIEAQKKDALVINLAGRQRMLIQLMTRLASGYQNWDDDNDASDLISAAETFGQTLSALQYGGQAPYLEKSKVTLPPADSADIQSQLDQVQISWGPFQAAIVQITELPYNDVRLEAAQQTIKDFSPVLVEHADSVVRLYEAESTQKVVRLRNFQIGFFVCALLLLGFGFKTVQKSVLLPLDLVGSRAKRIGTGDLHTSLGDNYPGEISLLDRTFDNMQVQLRDSRKELITWGETLEKRVDQRTRVLDALYEISRDISSRLDVQYVLDSVTDKAKQLLDAEIATLCLLNKKKNVLVIRSHSGPENAVIASQLDTRSGLAGKVLAQRHVQSCQHGDCEAACQILASNYRTSHLVAPLWAGEDQVVGVLCVGSAEPEVFLEDAIPLLTKLASSAAIAIENARLYSQAEQAATFEERQRIAAEMHDRLGQTISKIGLNIDLAEKHIENDQIEPSQQQLKSARESVDQASEDVREAIAHLLDDTPIHQSLQSQIESIVNDLQSQAINGSNLNWHNSIVEPVILLRKETEQVVRVAGEALNNACRHSKAISTDIYLQQTNGDYVLVIEDDGKGFDPQKFPEDGAKHFGLKIMQARAAHLGGDLMVKSAPGEGTRVTLRWPISDSPNRRFW